MAWLDTLIVGTAILSLSVKSLSVLTLGSRVTSNIGKPPTLVTPFTWPLVRSQSSSILETPLVTRSTLPDNSASVAAPPLLNVTQVILNSGSPAALACFSTSLFCSMTTSGR